MNRRATKLEHHDDRQMAYGLREPNGPDHRPYPNSSHWVEGNGRAPLGWEAWDYEQERGYRAFHMGAYESAWSQTAEEQAWSPEEIGMHSFDMMEEQEDELTGVMPMRTVRWARDWGFEGPLVPNPVLTKTDLKHIAGDPAVKAYVKERKAEAVRQRKADEDGERRLKVNEERRNIRAMQRAARDTVLAKIESGFEGRAEVQVRKGNQTLKWTYRVEDGVAYIDRKVGGWVALHERR